VFWTAYRGVIVDEVQDLRGAWLDSSVSSAALNHVGVLASVSDPRIAVRLERTDR